MFSSVEHSKKETKRSHLPKTFASFPPAPLVSSVHLASNARSLYVSPHLQSNEDLCLSYQEYRRLQRCYIAPTSQTISIYPSL